MKRIDILKKSLEKKEQLFNDKINNHFKDVNQANGQPLNDKYNGSCTLNRWEDQNNSLRLLNKSIEKTKNAIEKEEYKIKLVNSVELPKAIQDLIIQGVLVQWRKYPNRFFVVGVDKARIILNDDLSVGCTYVQNIPTKEQYGVFRDVFNNLRKSIKE